MADLRSLVLDEADARFLVGESYEAFVGAVESIHRTTSAVGPTRQVPEKPTYPLNETAAALTLHRFLGSRPLPGSVRDALRLSFPHTRVLITDNDTSVLPALSGPGLRAPPPHKQPPTLATPANGSNPPFFVPPAPLRIPGRPVVIPPTAPFARSSTSPSRRPPSSHAAQLRAATARTLNPLHVPAAPAHRKANRDAPSRTALATAPPQTAPLFASPSHAAATATADAIVAATAAAVGATRARSGSRSRSRARGRDVRVAARTITSPVAAPARAPFSLAFGTKQQRPTGPTIVAGEWRGFSAAAIANIRDEEEDRRRFRPFAQPSRDAVAAMAAGVIVAPRVPVDQASPLVDAATGGPFGAQGGYDEASQPPAQQLRPQAAGVRQGDVAARRVRRIVVPRSLSEGELRTASAAALVAAGLPREYAEAVAAQVSRDLVADAATDELHVGRLQPHRRRRGRRTTPRRAHSSIPVQLHPAYAWPAGNPAASPPTAGSPARPGAAHAPSAGPPAFFPIDASESPEAAHARYFNQLVESLMALPPDKLKKLAVVAAAAPGDEGSVPAALQTVASGSGEESRADAVPGAAGYASAPHITAVEGALPTIENVIDDDALGTAAADGCVPHSHWSRRSTIVSDRGVDAPTVEQQPPTTTSDLHSPRPGFGPSALGDLPYPSEVYSSGYIGSVPSAGAAATSQPGGGRDFAGGQAALAALVQLLAQAAAAGATTAQLNQIAAKHQAAQQQAAVRAQAVAAASYITDVVAQQHQQRVLTAPSTAEPQPGSPTQSSTFPPPAGSSAGTVYGATELPALTPIQFLPSALSAQPSAPHGSEFLPEPAFPNWSPEPTMASLPPPLPVPTAPLALVAPPAAPPAIPLRAPSAAAAAQPPPPVAVAAVPLRTPVKAPTGSPAGGALPAAEPAAPAVEHSKMVETLQAVLFTHLAAQREELLTVANQLSAERHQEASQLLAVVDAASATANASASEMVQLRGQLDQQQTVLQQLLMLTIKQQLERERGDAESDAGSFTDESDSELTPRASRSADHLEHHSPNGRPEGTDGGPVAAAAYATNGVRADALEGPSDDDATSGEDRSSDATDTDASGDDDDLDDDDDDDGFRDEDDTPSPPIAGRHSSAASTDGGAPSASVHFAVPEVTAEMSNDHDTPSSAHSNDNAQARLRAADALSLDSALAAERHAQNARVALMRVADSLVASLQRHHQGVAALATTVGGTTIPIVGGTGDAPRMADMSVDQYGRVHPPTPSMAAVVSPARAAEGLTSFPPSIPTERLSTSGSPCATGSAAPSTDTRLPPSVSGGYAHLVAPPSAQSLPSPIDPPSILKAWPSPLASPRLAGTPAGAGGRTGDAGGQGFALQSATPTVDRATRAYGRVTTGGSDASDVSSFHSARMSAADGAAAAVAPPGSAPALLTDPPSHLAAPHNPYASHQARPPAGAGGEVQHGRLAAALAAGAVQAAGLIPGPTTTTNADTAESGASGPGAFVADTASHAEAAVARSFDTPMAVGLLGLPPDSPPAQPRAGVAPAPPMIPAAATPGGTMWSPSLPPPASGVSLMSPMLDGADFVMPPSAYHATAQLRSEQALQTLQDLIRPLAEVLHARAGASPQPTHPLGGVGASIAQPAVAAAGPPGLGYDGSVSGTSTLVPIPRLAGGPSETSTARWAGDMSGGSLLTSRPAADDAARQAAVPHPAPPRRASFIAATTITAAPSPERGSPSSAPVAAVVAPVAPTRPPLPTAQLIATAGPRRVQASLAPSPTGVLLDASGSGARSTSVSVVPSSIVIPSDVPPSPTRSLPPAAAGAGPTAAAAAAANAPLPPSVRPSDSTQSGRIRRSGSSVDAIIAEVDAMGTSAPALRIEAADSAYAARPSVSTTASLPRQSSNAAALAHVLTLTGDGMAFTG